MGIAADLAPLAPQATEQRGDGGPSGRQKHRKISKLSVRRGGVRAYGEYSARNAKRALRMHLNLHQTSN